jgi:hypothetical protein
MPIEAGARAGLPVRRRPASPFADEVLCGGYTRHVRRDGSGRPTAQILVIPGHRVQMSVKAADDALDFDFRRRVIRPDLGPDYCRRPGIYLHEVLESLRDSRVILLNGNNVGYWGNQFVIDNGRLVYKPKGPLFDDGRLHAHATGDHAFFVDSQRSPHRYQIVDVKLFGRPKDLGDSGVELEVVARHVPPYGISGFPLLRKGRAVWREHGEYAWDPGLLFDLGALRRGDKYPEIRAYVRRLLDEGAPLAHHPMTVVGLNRDHDIVLLVVERTAYSPGMTVARAADLLATRFDVRDAIVLGAAGDTQLATTEEGFLITPFIADYAQSAARAVPPHLLSAQLSGVSVWARPVPSYVLLQITD